RDGHANSVNHQDVEIVVRKRPASEISMRHTMNSELLALIGIARRQRSCVRFTSNYARIPAKTRGLQRPASKTGQQLSQPYEICKPPPPGPNPGGASIPNPRIRNRASGEGYALRESVTRPLITGTPLIIEHDEPVAFGGTYRVVILTNPDARSRGRC